MGKLLYSDEEFSKLVEEADNNVELVGHYQGSNIPSVIRYKTCGHEFPRTLSQIKRHTGCPFCNNRFVLRGFNDLWCTVPEVAKSLKDPEDYLHLTSSLKKTWFVCPYCHKEYYKSIKDAVMFGICPCSIDGYSQGEKAIMYLLNLYNIDYETQKKFDWAKNKKYDFYIKDTSTIIEVNGKQHYVTNNYYNNRDEKQNDIIKFNLAKNNGIQNYIILDYSEASIEKIIENFFNSELIKLYPFIKRELLNIQECILFSSSSLMKKCWDLWNSHKYTNIEIAKMLHLASNTTANYLRIGTQYNICDYDGQKEKSLASSHKIICLNTGEVFNSITDAQKRYNVSNISANCLGTIKSAGKHPITGERLIWMYYEDYLKNKHVNINYRSNSSHMVVNIETGLIFDRIKDAIQWCGLKDESSISNALSGKTSYAGKHPNNKTPLHWMDYDEYIKKYGALI